MKHIALYLPSLAGGGMERSLLNLGEGMLAMGYQVDIVVNRLRGEYLSSLPSGLNVLELNAGNIAGSFILALRADSRLLYECCRLGTFMLNAKKKMKYLSGLVDYLREKQPFALISAGELCNLMAVWARQVANTNTRIIVSQRNMLSKPIAARTSSHARWRHMARFIEYTYPGADAVVTVSKGVAEDLSVTAKVDSDAITTIYNPVVTSSLAGRANESVAHPWLQVGDGVPTIVAAGRLRAQKNFSLLLNAFALLRHHRPARLIIMGEGEERSSLEALSHELEISDCVDMPGFSDNPYAVFSRADLFVFSSAYEGLGNVLIEALACGCPVVSTDCPSGPAEILEEGRYGLLVPVGNVEALAEAMSLTLDNPLPAETLKRRAAEFSLESSLNLYLGLTDRAVTPVFEKHAVYTVGE
ncbi:glycosyltransferase [Kushneria phosphatilytica]|uniref:Glycosyltransferase n=1 Tax=Kushneria phosphatilytica TaxID=657387 RepID=A0A5C0ZX74_9GAMM|nr:glycosyltransferase [Kushneria phosphatilytica]QEL10247.1 glycosyltransferase [Kushneria phosphatilytica]